MAFHRSQAWVTSVLTEDAVVGALVLAASLRRSKTTRQIAVLTSNNLDVKSRKILHNNFDSVLVMDEGVFDGYSEQKDRDRFPANAYTVSLIMFEKCVFVSPNSMVLENADSLFETNHKFECRANPRTGAFDLSVFKVEPETQLWKRFLEGFRARNEFSANHHLDVWLQKEKIVCTKTQLASMVADFSSSTGSIYGAKTKAAIIKFLPNDNIDNMLNQLTLLQTKELGLLERKIVGTWMEIYGSLQITNAQLAEASHMSNSETKIYKNEPIAIVGMSCRYPGANNVHEFWNMLYAGEEAIREPPAFRWTKEHTLRVSPQDRKSQAGFLATKVDEFDARFFGESPKEAAYLDPQTRILHEVLWESLEDAGVNPQSLYGTHTGIFTGSWMNNYRDIAANSGEQDFFRTYMGNSIGAGAARLSHLLGITGPCIATESGCSSAIVAVDLAVKSLRAGETNLAMAGGVNLLLHPFNSSIMEYVISPDGRCKTFDAKANGFGRAEGCGVLVLKRLGDALRDRDNIWAVIRGSAVSQEGLSRSLGTPTLHCEALAMQLALKDANVLPEEVSFVETHGTGTAVGDPLEVSAIAKTYHSRNRKHPLIIGSVKTNVGHTESCSGITGIMKAVLAMHHQIIPKHRNLETLNPEIFLDSIPAIIPTEMNLPWPKVAGLPRVCGVSSFGITGTDGHVILEEAPDNDLPKWNLGQERPTHLLTISGKTSDALQELLAQYENRFAGNVDDNKSADMLANICYSANVGRAKFSHRAFLVAKDAGAAFEILKHKKFVTSNVEEEGKDGQLCFLFTGQGSQYAGMAKQLFETSPVFRVHFDACDHELQKKYGVSIKSALWSTADTNNNKENELRRTIYSQTSTFCVEYCLLRMWQSWGVKPDYVLGHSLGEFCAAVAAGILDFEDALKLVAERSRLIDNLSQGSMLVVRASQPEVDKLMKDAKVELDFAAVNSAEQTGGWRHGHCDSIPGLCEDAGRESPCFGGYARLPLAPHGPDAGGVPESGGNNYIEAGPPQHSVRVGHGRSGY